MQEWEKGSACARAEIVVFVFRDAYVLLSFLLRSGMLGRACLFLMFLTRSSSSLNSETQVLQVKKRMIFEEMVEGMFP